MIEDETQDTQHQLASTERPLEERKSNKNKVQVEIRKPKGFNRDAYVDPTKRKDDKGNKTDDKEKNNTTEKDVIKDKNSDLDRSNPEKEPIV